MFIFLVRSTLNPQDSLIATHDNPNVQPSSQVPIEFSAVSHMSDQDLIRYINPSAFDQGNFNFIESEEQKSR